MVTRPRIRQLGLGELLDETFQLYRNNFLDFVAIVALVFVPYMLVNFVIQLPFQQQMARLQQPGAQADPFGGMNPIDFFSTLLFGVLGSILLSLLFVVVFQPLMEGALARAISRRYMDQPTSIGDAFGAALRHALALIGARLIPTLIGFVFGGLFFGLFFGGMMLIMGAAFNEDANINPALGVVLMLLGFGLFFVFILVTIFVAIRLLFTSQSIMVEGQGAWSAIVRSWRLTQNFFWRTFGYFIVIALLVAIIAGIPSFIITIPATLLLQDQPQLLLLISTVVNTVMQTLVLPFSMIAYTLLYFDLRVRKEGFDLEQQAGGLMGMGGIQPYPQNY